MSRTKIRLHEGLGNRIRVSTAIAATRWQNNAFQIQSKTIFKLEFGFKQTERQQAGSVPEGESGVSGGAGQWQQGTEASDQLHGLVSVSFIHSTVFTDVHMCQDCSVLLLVTQCKPEFPPS